MVNSTPQFNPGELLSANLSLRHNYSQICEQIYPQTHLGHILTQGMDILSPQ